MIPRLAAQRWWRRLAVVGVALAVLGCGSSSPRRTGHGAAGDGGDGLAGDGATMTAANDGAVASAVVTVDAGAAAPSLPVRAIGVGEHLSCALLDSGAVRCWGALRLAATPQASVPTAVGIEDGVALAVGTDHVCVARRDGSVWCWGANRDGAVGDGTTEPRGAPVEVAGVGGIVEIVAGGHQTCARDDAGAVWCWGHAGAVGHPRVKDARRPGRVEGLGRATRLVAGDDITCAFVADGPPRCWGFNTTGLLGDMLGPSTRAVRSAMLARAVEVALGFRTVCLTQADGAVYCAGDDQFGQLGDQWVPDEARCDPYDKRGVVCRWTDPEPAPWRDRCRGCPDWPDHRPPPPKQHEEIFAARSGPVMARGVRATRLAAGYGRSCAIGGDGPAAEVTCWGQWYSGGDWAHRRPRVIAGTAGAVAIAVAEEHACALLADRTVRCWGYNRSGELGNGTFTENLGVATAAAAVPF